MKKLFFSTLLILYVATASAQTEMPDTLATATGNIYGTLLIPKAEGKIPVVLIIAGSGPTDRNGNNPMMTNNSLKFLAEDLYNNGIATLRYDKRGIAASNAAMTKEEDLRFETYINDATDWITKLKQDNRFSKVIVIGHSEGSLIGMVAAKKANADVFISIAGVGQSADETLKEQIAKSSPAASAIVNPMLDSLKNGFTLKKVDPTLYSLFRPSVQPYMISWFKYNPQTEIAKLTIPTLILQGDNDIQVSVDDAKLLSKANPKAELKVIKKMNHILKESPTDREGNIATYSKPDLPIDKTLMKIITDFIKKNQ